MSQLWLRRPAMGITAQGGFRLLSCTFFMDYSHVEKEIKEFLQQVQRGNKYLKALCQYSRKRCFVSAIAYFNSESVKQTSL